LHDQSSELIDVLIFFYLLGNRAVTFGTVCLVEEKFEEEWAAVVS